MQVFYGIYIRVNQAPVTWTVIKNMFYVESFIYNDAYSVRKLSCSL